MTGGILTVIRRCLFNSLWFRREISQYKTLSEKIHHARIIIHKTYEFTIKEHKTIFPSGRVVSSTLEEVLTRNSHHVI
jgi:hypothetical protein